MKSKSSRKHLRIGSDAVIRSITYLKVICVAIVIFGCLAQTASAQSVAYTYDSLNRLTNVNYGNSAVISYTYDAAGNRLTYSGVVTNDAVTPTIAIISPTSGPNYITTNATVNLSGTASDNTGVSLITWINDRGASALPPVQHLGPSTDSVCKTARISFP
jgi:YD repeat-containing protein